MSAFKTTFCAAVSSLSLMACSSMDSLDPSQRNAAIGGGLGALAGAAISDDDVSGALIGGALAARNRAAASSAASRSPRGPTLSTTRTIAGTTTWIATQAGPTGKTASSAARLSSQNRFPEVPLTRTAPFVLEIELPSAPSHLPASDVEGL